MDNETYDFIFAEEPTRFRGLEDELVIDMSCANTASDYFTDEASHGMVLTASGKVFSFGADYGALGLSSYYDDGPYYVQYPTQVTLPAGKFATQIWVFTQLSVVGFSDTTLHVFGKCDRFCLIDDSDTPFWTPASGMLLNISLGAIVDVSFASTASNYRHGLFCASNGKVYASGSNYYSQFMISWLVVGGTYDTPIEVPLGPDPGCLKVYALEDCSLILLSTRRGLDVSFLFFSNSRLSCSGNGTVWAGGNNETYILGINSWEYNEEKEADHPVRLPFPPNFLVTQLGVVDPPRHLGSAWAVGIDRVTKGRQIYTWGADIVSYPMIPAVSASYTPAVADYLLQDTSTTEYPTLMYPAPGTGLLVTNQGRVLAWQPSSRSSSSTPLTITASTVLDPVETDIRNLIPPDFEVAQTYSASVSSGHVLLLDKRNRFFIFTGDSESRLIGTPKHSPVKYILEDVNAAGPMMLVLDNGEVWAYGQSYGHDYNTEEDVYIGNETSTELEEFVPMPGFDNLQVSRIAPYLPFEGSSLTGWMLLAKNGSVFWLGSAPIPDPTGDAAYDAGSYIDKPTPLLRSKMVPSSEPNLEIADIRGFTDTFFYKDTLNRWWGFGQNNFSQLCSPATHFVLPAIQLLAPGNGTIRQVFPTLNVTFSNGTGPTLLEPATIFLTESDEIYVCGSSPFANIGTVATPTRIRTDGIGVGVGGKKITLFDVGLFSMILQTSNDEIWTIGSPFSSNNWTRVDNRGRQLQGRIADAIGTVSLGGALISSSLRVASAEVFAGLSSVPITGSSFGVPEDLAGVDIFMWADPSNPIACRATSRSARQLTCVLDQPFDAALAGRSIYANVSVGFETHDNVLVGTAFGLPILTDSIDQLIATNADEVVLNGTGFSRVSQISFVGAQFSVIEQTNTHIRCRLSALGLTEGSYLRASVAVAGQSLAAASVQLVAKGVKRTLSIQIACSFV